MHSPGGIIVFGPKKKRSVTLVTVKRSQCPCDSPNSQGQVPVSTHPAVQRFHRHPHEMTRLLWHKPALLTLHLTGTDRMAPGPHLALDGSVPVPQPGQRTPSPHPYQEQPCAPAPGGQICVTATQEHRSRCTQQRERNTHGHGSRAASGLSEASAAASFLFPPSPRWP